MQAFIELYGKGGTSCKALKLSRKNKRANDGVKSKIIYKFTVVK